MTETGREGLSIIGGEVSKLSPPVTDGGSVRWRPQFSADSSRVVYLLIDTGFSVQFSSELDTSVLNLYDTELGDRISAENPSENVFDL